MKRRKKSKAVESVAYGVSSHKLRSGAKILIEKVKYQVRGVFGLDQNLGFNILSDEGKIKFEEASSQEIVARANLKRVADGRGFIISEYADGTFSWPEDLGLNLGSPELESGVSS